MKDILKLIINDLEKNAIGLAILEAKIQHQDLKLAGEVAQQKNQAYYDSLRSRVDALS